MRALLIVVAALAATSCSPISSECAKADECGELGDQSVDQCKADWEKKQADTEAHEECATVVERTLALFDCKSGLSCEERKDVGASVCASANSDLVGAVLAKPGCLFK